MGRGPWNIHTVMVKPRMIIMRVLVFIFIGVVVLSRKTI